MRLTWSGTATCLNFGRRFTVVNCGGLEESEKLLLLDVGHVSVGMRFGMTGRLIVDDEPAIDQLLYTTNEMQENIFVALSTLKKKGALSMIDPRHLEM